MENNKSQSSQTYKKNGRQGDEPVATQSSENESESEKMTQLDVTQSRAPDNSANLFDAIKSLKDYALIISLFCYICGFFLWAFYLYRYDTGFLIIHDINLIISGLFPVSLILSVFYIKENFEKISTGFIEIFQGTYLESLSKNFELGLFISIALFFIITAINIIFIKLDNIFMSIFLAILPPGIISLNEDLFDRKLTPSLYKSIIFYASIASLTFFQSIPQEFGGAKPRYVSLDIDSAQFSSQTLKYLGLADTDKPQSTDPIVMLYSNSDYIVAKTIDSSEAITLKNRYVSSVRTVDKMELEQYTNRLAERDRYIKELNLQKTCEFISTPYLSSCPTPVPLRHFSNQA